MQTPQDPMKKRGGEINVMQSYPEQSSLSPEQVVVVAEDSMDHSQSNQQAIIDDDKVGPSHFLPLKVLGSGSFGEVYLVKERRSGKLYAMKVLSKERIMGQNLVRYAKTERDVLSYTRHPFIVNLNAAFQTRTKLYLILDFCPG